MKLQHEFDVPTDPATALAALLDAERVVPCMPGAKLDEIVDERSWKATVGVKLGPVGLTFAADIAILEVDEEAHTATLSFDGRDKRGKGGAQGTVSTKITAIDGGSKVEMETDLKFSGIAARLGRPGIVKSVSESMVGRFADCLKEQLEGGS